MPAPLGIPAAPAPSGPPPLVAGRGLRAAFWLLLALLVLAPAPAPADPGGLVWLGYDQAAELARGQRRPLVLFFSAPWCYLCKKMQRQVFSDPMLAGRLQKQAYPVLVDISKQPRLMEVYEIKQVPTTIFLDLNGKPVLRLTGYQNRAALGRALEFVAKGHHRRMSWEAFSARP